MDTESQNDDTNKTAFPDKAVNEKIECKSLRSLLHIVDFVESELAVILGQNNGGDNETLRSKIIQVYKSVLSANIACDGQPATLTESELDFTSEYEAFDAANEHHVTHVLMDQLQQQMVATARLRKTSTARVNSRLKKLMRAQFKHLCTVEVQTESKDGVAMETDVAGDDAGCRQGSLEERLQGVGQQAHSMEQMCADMLLKAKDLAEAVHIYQRSEGSEFQRAMCETPPSTPEAGDTNCLQMTRLDRNIFKKLPI